MTRRLGGILILGGLGLVLALSGGALAGGAAGPLDPLMVLRGDQQVTRVEVVATRAAAQRLRVSWGNPATSVDLVLSNEALTVADAQTVRRVTAGVYVPAGRTLGSAQLLALEHVTRRVAGICLGQTVPDLAGALRVQLGRALPAAGPLMGLPGGVRVEVRPDNGGAWLQVSVPLGQGTPRCGLPS